jgi:4-hydroxyphenylpyruvate dioxygenase
MKMMKEDLNEIEKLAIMVDADEEGIYCKSLQTSTRQTYFNFFEIIQKNGSKTLVQVILKLCLSL